MHAECKIISESEPGVVSFVADKGLAPGSPKWANYVKASRKHKRGEASID